MTAERLNELIGEAASAAHTARPPKLAVGDFIPLCSLSWLLLVQALETELELAIDPRDLAGIETFGHLLTWCNQQSGGEQ